MRNYALILLVEDDEDRVNEFRSWFEHPRIRIVHARFGEKALGCLNEQYDLILLDHDLREGHPLDRPTIDGRKVVARLIETAKNRRTPIVIHSMNPAGRNQMFKALRGNGHSVEIWPFADWDRWYAQAWVEELIADLEPGQ